ncbi:cysteine desulfurase NifS [Candidatus Woesearchaeota archaeon CG10_big_fil_rev_8_21_14_0_10_44_13]|nr:MAG: cysteine desulfurase NifS [Candidatus Woesearchaeota archaeon CG10_big_fil_rev_8_21_14_0_10_44_13]
MRTIYLDNGATTKIDPKVLEAMQPYMTEKYGNASSTHHKGQEAKIALEDARSLIAKSINAKPEEIIFTSGGTESNNLAIKGLAFANSRKGKHIITTNIEHDCVLNACKWLETQGFKVTNINVDKEGFIDPAKLEKAITKDTILVSMIHGNNEIGTIQDIKSLGEICRRKGVFFHIDACQSYTKTEIDVRKHNLDLVTINSHKIHGPKGVGALYIRKGINITPLAHGGGHEQNLRSGTENVPSIVGFAKAVRIADKGHARQMVKMRDYLIEKVLKIPETYLNGPSGDKNGDRRLCNNANFRFSYVEGEAIGGYLDAKGICSSTGSACSSRSLEPSHVLMAIGLKPEEAHGSLRLTISRFTTKEEVDYVLSVLPGVIKKLRAISSLGGF